MSVRLREEDDVLSNTYCDGPAGASVPQPNQPPRDRTSLLVRVVSFGIYHHRDSNVIGESRTGMIGASMAKMDAKKPSRITTQAHHKATV